MDNRLLLVKAITLLYRESLLTNRDSNSADLIRTVLEKIKLPEIQLAIDHDKKILSSLKDTALYMCGNPPDTDYEAGELLQRLKVNCDYDERLYDSFVQGIDKEMNESSVKRTVLSIRKFIHDSFRENEIVNIVNTASHTLMFRRDSIKDIRDFVRELSASLEPYQIEANRKDPAVVARLDIGDTTSLNELFSKIQEGNDNTSILRTGWQGINRMLQGGFRRGETWTTAALQHNYKTGFTLSLFKQFAMYNRPIMTDPTKKPLLLRISTEDALSNNVETLYRNIYENEHGRLPEGEVDPKDVAEYVTGNLRKNGYQIKIERVDPSGWGYKDVQNRVLELEAEGYEIHVLMIDYLPMLQKTGLEQGPAGIEYRDLLRRMRNFCSARNILLITPWQLSTEAKMLIREGRTDFVKFIEGKGYYAGSKQIDQELDGELYLHIEKLGGRAWLTIQRGKHRLPAIIDDRDKYVVLPFTEKGCVLDDLGKEEITCRRVGGGPIGSPDEIPFFDFNTPD